MIRLDFMPSPLRQTAFPRFGNAGMGNADMNGGSGPVASPGAALVSGAARGIDRAQRDRTDDRGRRRSASWRTADVVL
jgi:hypothetical protein